MNSDKIKIIEEITENNPNRLRESYFKNNYNSILQDILSYSNNIDVPFIQKIWHWVNDYPNYYLCDCGNRTSFNRNWLNGYKMHCSPKCAQSKSETKEKRRQTCIKKWGVDNVSKSDEIKEKQTNTNLERWGFKSSFQNESVKNKWRRSIEDKWGVDHYFKTEEFKIKAKDYYLQKWGVDHQLKVDEIKERIKKTCLIKYGVVTYLNTEHSRSCIKTTNKSSYEDEICLFLDELGVNYIRNTFKVIGPFSIDIWIPDYNLAIEFNGLYWHSEFFKDKKYHLDKTKLCRENKIRLIHIWEDDWLSRKSILKSIIKSSLFKLKNKIYARKCLISEVNHNESSKFLNENHLQGYTKFSKSIGLYYNKELVSLMCFGWRSTNGKKEYELIRYCNKIDTNVIGGVSKLFNHFLKITDDIETITSYSDISVFEGEVYEKLGFKKIGFTNINYWWVVKGVRKHRFNYNKSKLVKMGYDRTKTEVEIMHELNNYRVFGCGQEKWILEKTFIK